MPRRLRIEMAGGVYHVTNRGVDRLDIVRDDTDRYNWLRRLTRVANRSHWRVFAHVLMTNHFHLFLKIPEPNLSAGLHALESGFATQFNRRHGRSGALFQGRFHAVLVESETQAWAVSRYVHLNPCRAGLAAQPATYPWSSYRHYLDPCGAPAWLDWRTILSDFGGTDAAGRIAYRRFVERGLTEPPENPFANAYGGVLLGGMEFIERHRHLVDDPDADPTRPHRRVTIPDVRAVVLETFGVADSALTAAGRHGNVARDAAIWLCRELTMHSLDDVAAAFGGVSRSSVTDTVRRCERRMNENTELRQRCLVARERCTAQGSGVRISDLAGET